MLNLPEYTLTSYQILVTESFVNVVSTEVPNFIPSFSARLNTELNNFCTLVGSNGLNLVDFTELTARTFRIFYMVLEKHTHDVAEGDSLVSEVRNCVTLSYCVLPLKPASGYSGGHSLILVVDKLPTETEVKSKFQHVRYTHELAVHRLQ